MATNEIKVQINWTDGCKENVSTVTRRRTLGNNNEQGDKGHIARVRYCKIYKIPPTKMVWSCWKNAKTTNVKSNCFRYNGIKKNEGRPRKWWWDKVQGDSNTMGIKKEAGNGQTRRRKICLHTCKHAYYVHAKTRHWGHVGGPGEEGGC